MGRYRIATNPKLNKVLGIDDSFITSNSYLSLHSAGIV